MSIHNKNFNEVGLKGTYLNIAKGTYEKSTANIIFNGAGNMGKSIGLPSKS